MTEEQASLGIAAKTPAVIKLTPDGRADLRVKERYPDAILLYRSATSTRCSSRTPSARAGSSI